MPKRGLGYFVDRNKYYHSEQEEEAKQKDDIANVFKAAASLLQLRSDGQVGEHTCQHKKAGSECSKFIYIAFGTITQDFDGSLNDEANAHKIGRCIEHMRRAGAVGHICKY